MRKEAGKRIATARGKGARQEQGVSRGGKYSDIVKKKNKHALGGGTRRVCTENGVA